MESVECSSCQSFLGCLEGLSMMQGLGGNTLGVFGGHLRTIEIFLRSRRGFSWALKAPLIFISAS